MSIPNQEKWSAAERAVGQGHFDQAVRLLAQDAILDASGRRLAIDLHDRLTARCTHAIQANQWRTAIDSLGCLRDLEGSSSHVERLRADLETGLSSWVEQLIEADRFEEIEQLCRMAGSSKLELPSIEKIHSQISLIQGAKKLVALGRFAEAENSLQAYADSKGFFLGAIRKIQEGHEQAKKLLAELHRAAEANQWDVVLSTADKVLSISNRHPMAFSMRQRAIAELAAQGKKPRNRESEKKMAIAFNAHSTHAGGHYAKSGESQEVVTPMPILWIDGVGGFGLCDSIEAVIGQAVPGNPVELAIVGDLSRRAAAIRKSGEDHLLQPLQSVLVNQVKVDRATMLRHGDVISIGPRVEIRYLRTNKLSTTAKLEMASRHRWQPSVDGILLMGETCVLGPGSSSHILCPYWSSDVVIFRHRGGWMCKCPHPLEVDGKEYRDAVSLVPGTRVRGPDFSLTLE